MKNYFLSFFVMLICLKKKHLEQLLVIILLYPKEMN